VAAVPVAVAPLPREIPATGVAAWAAACKVDAILESTELGRLNPKAIATAAVPDEDAGPELLGVAF